jgi:NADH:ubiquinone oxidoreductase subunit D
MVDELDRYLTESKIMKVRTKGVGYLPPEMVIAYSTSGPLLRASQRRALRYPTRRPLQYLSRTRF